MSKNILQKINFGKIIKTSIHSSYFFRNLNPELLSKGNVIGLLEQVKKADIRYTKYNPYVIVNTGYDIIQDLYRNLNGELEAKWKYMEINKIDRITLEKNNVIKKIYLRNLYDYRLGVKTNKETELPQFFDDVLLETKIPILMKDTIKYTEYEYKRTFDKIGSEIVNYDDLKIKND